MTWHHTPDLARTDTIPTPPTPRETPAHAWTSAGIVAALAGIGTVLTTSMVDAAYDPALAGDPDAIVGKLATQTGPILAFHLLSTIGALAMIVFAAGLHRRLHDRMPSSTVPTIAFAGLLGTAVVSVLGSGLDTEYFWGLDQRLAGAADGTVFYGHWIGTVPWIWMLAGLTGLALFAASRQRALPRWIGVVGLVLGGLTALVGVSPLQYLAGFTGPVWLLITALGLAVGDRATRADR